MLPPHSQNPSYAPDIDSLGYYTVRETCHQRYVYIQT